MHITRVTRCGKIAANILRGNKWKKVKKSRILIILSFLELVTRILLVTNT